MKIHFFSDTGRAYDACQCDERVKCGDILIVTRERVVGIADTWPVAVTKRIGELHTGDACEIVIRLGRNAIKAAVVEAVKRKYAVNREFQIYCY